MLRRKKKKLDENSDGPGRLNILVRIGVVLVTATAVVSGMFVGLKYLEQTVLARKVDQPAATTVRVAFGVPAWMPQSLAEEIGKSLILPRAAFYDAELTADTYARARANPWIREVRCVTKKRTTDDRIALVEIDCEFRMAVARVPIGKESAREFAYVDSEGVRLPAKDVPQWMLEMSGDAKGPGTRSKPISFRDSDLPPAGAAVKALHYITIAGVESAPPAIGQPWSGGDIREGLRLVNLVLTHSVSTYANQIARVDVRNFDGRISKREPYLRMYAQVDDGPATDIKFGRFEVPGGGDFEISAEQKMSTLDQFFITNGNKLAGGASSCDLRYGDLLYTPS
ncbi:MAG: hypothetical protein WC869_12935 [Phycisphaerae bacterium]|jgi:hypothetical protein